MKRLSLSVLWLLAACAEDKLGGTDTGNGFAESALTIRGDRPSLGARSLTAQEITFDEAKIVLDEVEFRRAKDLACESSGSGGDDDDACEEALTSRFRGPFAVDLLTGTADPPLDRITIPTGTYVRAELELAKDTSLLGPDTSLFVRGTWQSPEGPVRFELRSDEDDEFEIRNDRGFTVAPGTLNSLLVIFDLDRWFAGVELANADVGDDGIIRLDDDDNPSLRQAVEQAVEGSATTGRDRDDDGDLEEDDEDSESDGNNDEGDDDDG